MNASYSFIENVNDFFSTGYFTEDFQKKVFDKSGYSADGIKELCSRICLASLLRLQRTDFLERLVLGIVFFVLGSKRFFTHIKNLSIR